MIRKARIRNEKFAEAIATAKWSYDACAAAVRAVAAEAGVDLASTDRSNVAYWVAGVRPTGQTRQFIAEAFTRRLGHPVNAVDLGFGSGSDSGSGQIGHDWWHNDPVADLVTIGRDDLYRRDMALKTLYSLAALTVPMASWQEIAERGTTARRDGGAVGRNEIESVREMVAAFSSADERLGGGNGRTAAVAYLTTDVAGYLRGRYESDDARQAMFSAAAELAYLIGWKSFDSADHGLAQSWYLRALRLANEASDGPLGAFILRAMAHQAVDLGHGRQCADLAESALELARGHGSPGVVALLTVVKARGYASQHEPGAAVAAIREAELCLGRADWGAEPGWLGRAGGFDEASLANQTAQCLRDLGDLGQAEAQFKRSVAMRNSKAHQRIHSLTLANLADVEFSRGAVDGACRHWNAALDEMPGVRSARAVVAVQSMRKRLASLGGRSSAHARELNQRATEFLAAQRIGV
jgi:tetratricopeptide (TPR) repeat protein